MNNEIINADYENVKYKSRISAVLAFERIRKLLINPQIYCQNVLSGVSRALFQGPL